MPKKTVEKHVDGGASYDYTFDAFVTELEDDNVKSIVLPSDRPASVLIVDGKVMLPGVDYTVAGDVATFAKTCSIYSLFSLIDLSDGSLHWSKRPIESVGWTAAP